MDDKHQNRRVSVTLTPEHAAMLDGAIKSGRVEASHELFLEALDLWRMREESRERESMRLRQMVREGTESGDGGEIEEVFSSLRRTLRERRRDTAAE